MFEPLELRKFVPKIVKSYGTGNKELVIQSLEEFREVWESQDCKNYISVFGKAAGILQNKDHEFAEVFNRDWFDFLDSGFYLSLVALTKDYDGPKLLCHISKINRLSESMQEHGKRIDKIFLNRVD